MKVSQFLDSDETKEFVMTINNFFDNLNSKSKHYGTHYKSTITFQNLIELQYYIHDAYSNGLKLMDCPTKSFILGFAISFKSILAVAKNLLSRNQNPFEYVLVYRFSHDQLEMLFSKIRSRLG